MWKKTENNRLNGWSKVSTAKTQPMISTRQIKDAPKSPMTTRRCLCKANLSAQSPPPKAPLLKKDMIEWIQFTKEHIHWPADGWKNIWWPDESEMYLLGQRAADSSSNTEFKTKETVKVRGAACLWALYHIPEILTPAQLQMVLPLSHQFREPHAAAASLIYSTPANIH